MGEEVEDSDRDRMADHWNSGLLAPEGTSRRLPRLVEYALLAILVAVVSLVAISLSGKASTKHFCEAYSQLDGPPPGARVDSCGHWHLP